MTVRNPLILIKRAAWPAAGMLVIAYFLGAAIVGEHGVLAWGQNRRLPPVDRCAPDPSFVAFRSQLRAAVARRDGVWLLSIAAPDIEYSFGDTPGRAGFARVWGLNRPATSRIWRELGEVLRLGC